LYLLGEGIGVYTLRRHFIEGPNGSRKGLKERRSRMNFIALKTFETALLETIIETSLLIKQNPFHYADVLKNKSLYMLFEKTSTRTALAFGLGFNELGGRYFIQRWQDSNFIVGEIPDETRYVARNVDIILARLKRNVDIEAMGSASPIPVINGCCNKYHPTQALADCMTVKEKFGTYDKTMLYVGIWNNVFNSLVASFPRLGGRFIGVCPIINGAAISFSGGAVSAITTCARAWPFSTSTSSAAAYRAMARTHIIEHHKHHFLVIKWLLLAATTKAPVRREHAIHLRFLLMGRPDSRP